MNQRKAGAILSYLNIIVVILAQFAYTPIMLRILGQSEYGVYSLSHSIIAYLSLLNFGFTGSYLKFYSKYKADDNQIAIKTLNAMYVIVFTIIAGVICISGYAIIQNIEFVVGDKFTSKEIVLTKILMAIMTINMAVMMPNNAFCSFIFAHEKFVFGKGMELLRNIGNPLICLPVLLLDYGSVGMSYVMLFITAISLVLNILYCKQKLQLGYLFNDIDWNVLKEIAEFSFYIFLWSIVDQLNWQVGKVILSNTSGSIAVAIFTVGTQFCMIFMIFSTAISGVFTPKIYALVYEDDASQKLTNLMIKVGRLQFYIVFLIWIGFVLFGKQFMILWAGEKYAEAYWVGVILMTPIVIALTQNVGIEMLRAYNKHQARTWWHFVVAVVNVFISYELAKEYGIVGCAIGSCISTFVSSTLVSNYFYAYVIKLNIREFFKELLGMLPAVLLVAVIGIVINNVIEIKKWTHLILVCALFTIAYAIVMVEFAFNEYERNLLKQVKQKLLGTC